MRLPWVPAGHPLAGQTGKAVTEALKHNTSIKPMLERIARASQGSSDNEAIGCILRRRPGTLRLGLMNASRLPLQIEAYCPRNRAKRPPAFRNADRWYHWQHHGEFLSFLQTVRDHPRLRSVEAEHRAFRVLLNDLKLRLEGLTEDVRVVPCGEVARAFVARAISLEGYRGAAEIWNPQQKVPHPSRGQWRNEENTQVVDRLVNMIHERSAPAPLPPFPRDRRPRRAASARRRQA